MVNRGRVARPVIAQFGANSRRFPSLPSSARRGNRTCRISYFRQVNQLLNPVDQKRVIVAGRAARQSDAVIPSSNNEMFFSRLVLPVGWSRLGHPPSRELRDAAERSNAAIVGFLLQGVDLEAMPRPSDERLAEALAPLRMKLDMIIGMLGRLSYRGVELPPLCEIEFGLNRVSWLTAQPLQSDDWLRIELYFDPIFREPVVVFGRVTTCTEQGPSEVYRIQTDLAEMSQSSGESIARLAFLTHRHQQAQHPLRSSMRREA